MVIGILCTVISTAIASYSAFAAFENRAASVDALVNKHLQVETQSTYIAFADTQNIVLYNKYERRRWKSFEDLMIRLCQSYISKNDIQDLSITSMRDVELDYLYQIQELRLCVLFDNVSTCLLKYVKRDMSWLQDQATLYVQQWLTDEMSNQDNQIVLNAIDLIELAADRATT